jgi:lipoprotein NlpI
MKTKEIMESILKKSSENQRIVYQKSNEVPPKELAVTLPSGQLPSDFLQEGNVLFERGEYDKSLVLFDRALSLNKVRDDIWNCKGAALAYLGRYREALTCFENALLLNKHSKEAWKNKGWMLNNLGAYHNAIKCFINALKLDDKFPDAWLDIGVALIHLNRHEEAISFLLITITLDDKDTWSWFYISLILAENNQIIQAKFCLRKALFIDNSWPRAVFANKIYDNYDAKKSSFEDIIAQVETLFSSGKYAQNIHEKIMTYYSAGKLFHALGHQDIAKCCLEKVRQLSSSFMPAQDKLRSISSASSWLGCLQNHSLWNTRRPLLSGNNSALLGIPICEGNAIPQSKL